MISLAHRDSFGSVCNFRSEGRTMKRRPHFVLFLVLNVLAIALLRTQDLKSHFPSPDALRKNQGSPQYQIMNINSLSSWMRADGLSNHSPSNNAGAVYPRFTSSVIYQDGILWGGKAYLDAGRSIPAPEHPLRVGGVQYTTGTRAGWIEGFGSMATRVDTARRDVRVFRIRRDWFSMSAYELARDAAETFESAQSSITGSHIEQIRAQYEKDWYEWPVHLGAPYIERNGIPGYQPPPRMSYAFDHDSLILKKHDEPGIGGDGTGPPAHQVLWLVYNDLDSTRTKSFLGTPPLGIEAQVTMWAYNDYGSIGSVVFKRIVLMNKGGVVVNGEKRSLFIDSLYISQWSDPDIGHPGDDLVGCDIALQMSYGYQGVGNDPEFKRFNLSSPAVGYLLLQGPVVPGSESDSAIVRFTTVKGKKNLGMHSFAWRPTPSPFGDPPTDPFSQGRMILNLIRGRTPVGGFFPHPPGVEPTLFPLSGDPVTATGFIDGLGTSYSLAPGDRSFFMNTGPFFFAPGDTQEVVIGLVAGLGGDPLSSISVMRYNARAARRTHRTHYDLPRGPARPHARAIELDGQIILEWGSDHERVRQTETTLIAKEYAFEGYTIYQLPSPTSRLIDGVRIATYDVVNGIRSIVDERFDVPTGALVSQVVQNGSDSGVRRQILITMNYLSEFNDPLYNGTEYYFAVTAYNYSRTPGTVPRSFESNYHVVRATPRIPFGTRLTTTFGDTLETTRVSGASDLKVYPQIVDPLAGTGRAYEVRFLLSEQSPLWFLRDASRELDLTSPQPLDTGLSSTHIFERGFVITFHNPRPGIGRWTSEGIRPVTWIGADGLQFESFNGAVGWGSPFARFNERHDEPVKGHELKTIEVRFARTLDNKGTIDPLDPRVSYSYRYGSGFHLPPAREEFSPFMVNRQEGFTYQDFSLSVPLAVYDIDSNPPRRLALGFLENNAPMGSVDGRYWPPVGSMLNNTAWDGPREWLFIFDHDYTNSPQSELQHDPRLTPLRVMYWATWARRDTLPWTGTAHITFFPTRRPSQKDVFRFIFPAPIANEKLRKASAQSVGVFPNPYLGGLRTTTTEIVRKVTFNNLPHRATIRIFNLAGHMVRTLHKDHPSQFLDWNLANEHGWQVASGIYICYVEMPDVGETKILKLSIVQSTGVFDR